MAESSNVLAEGTLYVNRLLNGVYQGIEKWPGLFQFEYKPNADLKEAITKDKGKYGNISASVAVNKPADFSLTITEVAGPALAAAMQGGVTPLNEAAGSVTDEAVTAKLGRMVKLAHRNIVSAGFVLTNSAGTTTYVLGTDYTVNYAMGFLEILSTGTIADAEALKVDYTHNAITGSKIDGGTVPQVKGELYLDGNNLVDGRPLQVIIWDATLTADGAVDFMSDDFVQLKMKGRLSTPSNKPSAIEVHKDLAFA